MMKDARVLIHQVTLIVQFLSRVLSFIDSALGSAGGDEQPAARTGC